MTGKQWLNGARLATWRLEFADLAWPDSGLTTKWENRARLFREKGINAIVISGIDFRWDYLPFFERIAGILTEIAEICHRNDLNVIDRHAPTRMHQLREQEDRRKIRALHKGQVPFYPDDWSAARYNGEEPETWRQTAAGHETPVYLPEETAACFCPNHPGFQRSYLDYVKKLVAAAPIDALLSSEAGFQPDTLSCDCSHCRQRWKEETGREFPRLTDAAFRENRDSSDFQAWIAARYRWHAEHYKRLRENLPKRVLLLASFPGCLGPELAETGTSPLHIIEHLDAICYEVPPSLRLGGGEPEIMAELAAFNSLAQAQSKGFITRFRADHPDQVARWVHFLGKHSRPWLTENTQGDTPATVEHLLSHGFGTDKAKKSPLPQAVQAILFSASFRDRLSIPEALQYVESYQTLSGDLQKRGSATHIVHDTTWPQTPPESWECLWILDPRAIDDDRRQVVEAWQDKGLPVGIA